MDFHNGRFAIALPHAPDTWGAHGQATPASSVPHRLALVSAHGTQRLLKTGCNTDFFTLLSVAALGYAMPVRAEMYRFPLLQRVLTLLSQSVEECLDSERSSPTRTTETISHRHRPSQSGTTYFCHQRILDRAIGERGGQLHCISAPPQPRWFDRVHGGFQPDT